MRMPEEARQKVIKLTIDIGGLPKEKICKKEEHNQKEKLNRGTVTKEVHDELDPDMEEARWK